MAVPKVPSAERIRTLVCNFQTTEIRTNQDTLLTGHSFIVLIVLAPGGFTVFRKIFKSPQYEPKKLVVRPEFENSTHINLFPHVNLTAKPRLSFRGGRQIGEEFGRSLLRNCQPINPTEEDVILKWAIPTLLVTSQSFSWV